MTTRLIPIAPAAAGFSACLGVFFLGSALAQTPPAPAAATPDSLPRQITSKVLFVTDSKDPKKQSGAMDVILRISENTSGQPVVSCSIPTPGVRNDQWQAAAWMAAFVASRRLDLQVSDYEFNINATGVIDGPSAGMELAASLIALINNVPIKPGRIMTGSVNPDGTIGPVGGIAAKIEAASRLAATPAAGAEPAAFVGIPIGQRIEFREAENKYIDLIDFARQRKVTAVELRDVDDAYFFLTEQRLPSSGRSAPVTTPQVSLAAINRLRSAHLAMQEEVNAGTKALSAICERRAPGGTARDYDGHFLLGQLGLAGDYSRRATAASNGGALIAGYYQLLKAAACADIGKNYDRILGAPSGKTKGGDKDDRILSAVRHIIELRGEVAQSREKLATAIKESIGSRQLVLKLEALNAQISLREAYSYEVAADDMVLGTLVQMLKAEADAGGKGRVAAPDFYPMVQQACTYYALAKTRYTAAHNWYSFSLARDKGNDLEVRPGLPFFQNIGSAFSKGAQSALAYLDATMKQGWEAYLEGNEPPIKFEGSQVPFKIRGARNEGLPIRIAMAGNIPFNDENFPRIASLIEGRYLPARKAAFSEANADGSDGGEAAGLLAGPQATAVPDSPLAQLLKEKWDFTTPPTGDLDAFGSGASAFLSLSSLVMKYYNYQGDDQRMTNSRSIGIYIDLARSKALARAGLLRERILARLKPERREQPGWEGPGAENDSLLPEAITVNLELADILRYGGPDDKVISLMTFWRANMLADIALSMITYSDKNAQ